MNRRQSIAALVLSLFAGFAAYFRLAPAKRAAWHIFLDPRPENIPPPIEGEIATLRNGAYVELNLSAENAQRALAAIDIRAAATPRTTLFAGSLTEGHMTWVTRSQVWGFPDYTTAEITHQGLRLYARLRFGSSDFGVNAARLRDWLNLP